MGEALYRKYRSKSLDEIVGQEHITSTLKNALKSGNISHAYLFTGPRGTGKTSVARILAHEINQLPYDGQHTHLDIIEIDAASNRRIDEIRDLRDKVNIAPTSAKYKVYIIDEVHMLTREAFNALLKTLEEPPAHAIFILATTELHKLPETIISRTQRFTFKPADPDSASKHLASIAKQEGIKIDQDALNLLAAHGNGSFRDSVSLLDQASNAAGDVGADEVRTMLGVAPQSSLQSVWELVQSGQTSELVETLTTLENQGYSAARIAEQLASMIREDVLSHNADPRSLTILRKLLDVPAAADPARLLEIVLIEASLARSGSAQAQSVDTVVTAKQPAPKPTPKPVKEPTPEPKVEDDVKPLKVSQAKTPPSEEDEPPQIAPNLGQPLNPETWQQVLGALKAKHNTLYSIVRMAEPTIDGTTIVLRYKFPFHQKRMNEPRNKDILLTIVHDLTGGEVSVEHVHNANAKADTPPVHEPKAAKTPQTTPSSDTLRTVTDIFGGGEVVE